MKTLTTTKWYLRLNGCTAYMPATQLKNGPQIFSDGMRIQILRWPTTVTAKPKTKYLTAKPKTSQQKQKPHGKTKIPHGKTKTLTAKL